MSVNPRLVVLTVSTDDGFLVKNWERSLQTFGYEYRLLGRGEKWQGWQWRTKKYIEGTKEVPATDIVCLTDSNDILFLKHSNVLLQRFLDMGMRIVMGAESVCINGVYLDSDKRDVLHEQMKQIMGPDAYKATRYKFPNGGFIVGYQPDVLQLLMDNREAKDDQNGYLQMWLADTSKYTLDSGTQLVGNVILQIPFMLRNPDDEKPWESEWDNWEFKEGEFVSKVNKVSPCVMHFPGKDWPHYNEVGLRLGIPGFEHVESPILNWMKDGIQSAPSWWKINVTNILFVVSVLVVLAILIGLSLNTGYTNWYFDVKDRGHNPPYQSTTYQSKGNTNANEL